MPHKSAGAAVDLPVDDDATLLAQPLSAMEHTLPAGGAVEHVYLESTTVKPPLPPAQPVGKTAPLAPPMRHDCSSTPERQTPSSSQPCTTS